MQKTEPIKKTNKKSEMNNCRICNARCFGKLCHKHRGHKKYTGRLSMLTKHKDRIPFEYEEVFVCVLCGEAVASSRMPIKETKPFKFVCVECGEGTVKK